MASSGGTPSSLSHPVAAGGTLQVGKLSLRGVVEVRAGVGGLSGLWVSEDGERLTSVTDVGQLVTGRLSYDPQGWLAAVEDVESTPLPLDLDAASRKRLRDAEEITRLADGSWLVSFERKHRILRYRPSSQGPSGKPTRLPQPPGLEKAPANGGIEAMAALADGRLFVLEEGDDDGVRERYAWIGAPALRERDDWQPLTYRAAPHFRPVGAAGLPDGGALVLERRVSLLGGWGTRIVRVQASALRPGAVIVGEELARLEAPLPLDNYEGIAVRPGPGGEVLIYLVSDDNFMPIQATYVMMLALPLDDKKRDVQMEVQDIGPGERRSAL